MQRLQDALVGSGWAEVPKLPCVLVYDLLASSPSSPCDPESPAVLSFRMLRELIR